MSQSPRRAVGFARLKRVLCPRTRRDERDSSQGTSASGRSALLLLPPDSSASDRSSGLPEHCPLSAPERRLALAGSTHGGVATPDRGAVAMDERTDSRNADRAGDQSRSGRGVRAAPRGLRRRHAAVRRADPRPRQHAGHAADVPARIEMPTFRVRRITGAATCGPSRPPESTAARPTSSLGSSSSASDKIIRETPYYPQPFEPPGMAIAVGGAHGRRITASARRRVLTRPRRGSRLQERLSPRSPSKGLAS